MAHGHTIFDSKGSCIYCSMTGVKLTNEHIVPKSIGGQHVIRQASCSKCSILTSRFEREVMRGLWGDARTSYDVPSYRKAKRSKFIFLNDPKNRSKKLKVSSSEYPAPMVFYQMHPAGILQGLTETVDISAKWQMTSIVDEDRLKSFNNKYPGKLTAQFKHVPDSFARLIAKIGYGQALTLLNPDDFRPLCLPYVLGEKENISYVVGGCFDIPQPNKGLGYIMETFGCWDLEHMLILSEVRLIAHNHTPLYHVVVGDVHGEENVQNVIRKFDIAKIESMSMQNMSQEKVIEKKHWMPQEWPLPFWQ